MAGDLGFCQTVDLAYTCRELLECLVVMYFLNSGILAPMHGALALALEGECACSDSLFLGVAFTYAACRTMDLQKR